MARTPSNRRGELFPSEMASMQIGPGWDDGRKGFLFCRLDAIICRERMLRAELTWADDSDFTEDGKPKCYYDPLLTIESNRPHPGDSTSFVTLDAIHFDIDGDTAADLAAGPASRILDLYSSEIAQLQIYG